MDEVFVVYNLLLQASNSSIIFLHSLKSNIKIVDIFTVDAVFIELYLYKKTLLIRHI